METLKQPTSSAINDVCNIVEKAYNMLLDDSLCYTPISIKRYSELSTIKYKLEQACSASRKDLFENKLKTIDRIKYLQLQTIISDYIKLYNANQERLKELFTKETLEDAYLDCYNASIKTFDERVECYRNADSEIPYFAENIDMIIKERENFKNKLRNNASLLFVPNPYSIFVNLLKAFSIDLMNILPSKVTGKKAEKTSNNDTKKKTKKNGTKQLVPAKTIEEAFATPKMFQFFINKIDTYHDYCGMINLTPSQIGDMFGHIKTNDSNNQILSGKCNSRTLFFKLLQNHYTTRRLVGKPPTARNRYSKDNYNKYSGWRNTVILWIKEALDT